MQLPNTKALLTGLAITALGVYVIWHVEPLKEFLTGDGGFFD